LVKPFENDSKNFQSGNLNLSRSVVVGSLGYTIQNQSHFWYLIKAVVRPLADEYKVKYEEKEMADYRFCHSAIEYEGLI
jgi:hypothetical protein